jgi:serine O-acetyltransferase
MRAQFLRDVEAFFQPSGRRPSVLRGFVWALLEPGLLFALLLRAQQAAEPRSFVVARVLHVLNLRFTGGEVGLGCTIGGGLVVRHPIGIVIGGGTRIGSRVTILSGVVFGERRPGKPGQAYPVVGDDVTIGTGAVLLGGVTVGARAVVGARALVLSDVPAGAVVVGAPARVVRP